MRSTCDSSNDPAVIEPGALEADLRSRMSSAAPRQDAVGTCATGTGEQPVVTRDPDRLRARSRGTRELAPDPEPPLARSRGTRELDRDPAEVLRMWPHSIGVPEPGEISTCPGLSDSLDRELAQVHGADRAAVPMACAASDTCVNRRCTARAAALRGALVEACALGQRAALMTPDPIWAGELEDRLRELLELVDR